jgi:hypothetical protein
MKKMLALVLVVLSLLTAGSVCRAETIIMDATHHNGSFTDGPVDYQAGHWSLQPLSIPTGWAETSIYMYTTATRWIQTGTAGEAVNNTGELVQAGYAYTIQADLGGETGSTAIVRVYATQNSDGTGDKALLAQLTRAGTSATGDYTLYTVSSSGTGVSASLATYYIQVKIGDLSGTYHGGYYDNIVVTSEVATSMTYMNATLHNGGFAADIAGFWHSTPTAIPYGWTMVTAYPYTTAGRMIQVGSTGDGVNNTGELVLANHSYTVNADLGGGTGVHAWVRVYATENIDGTGNKVLLASVDRLGLATDGAYEVYPTAGTPGSGTPSSLAGYYVQVRIGGPYTDFGYYISGNYDNIVVTSEVATSMIYMNSTFHNGSFTDGPVGYKTGFWYNEPLSIPTGWTQVAPYPYTTATRFIQVGSTGEAVNNTGELVLAQHAFTVSADLGGGEGVDATVRVFATQNSDGTGTKVELAKVNRVGQAGDAYTLFPVSATGTPVSPSLAGYYVQVTIGGPYVTHYISGNYDNIVVTSELSQSAPIETYMSGTFHNGVMDSEERGGSWGDEVEGSYIYQSYEWLATDPNSIWTASAGFITFDSQVEAVTNNTGETVPANHQFIIQADLGGFPGALATASVYATQNIDGTGNKSLLAEVSRAGDANGLTPLYQRYTVSGAGMLTSPDIAGYYVQVLLKTIGDPNLNGHYDNLVVTSQEVPASIVYMDPNIHNGAMNSAMAGGYWTDPNYIPFEWSSTHPALTYTAALGLVLFDGQVDAVTNNTGGQIFANHKFTVQAGLGGKTGATAKVSVYATQNIDGTGNKVLLAEVSQPGNTASGYTLSTVSNTGLPTAANLVGYYVQVELKTTGTTDLYGYYDNIRVTSAIVGPVCGDTEHPYPAGDLNQDCYVDFEDVDVFAGQWLASGCVTPSWCSGADMSTDGNVKFNDFAILAANWFDCTDPNPPCSYNP